MFVSNEIYGVIPTLEEVLACTFRCNTPIALDKPLQLDVDWGKDFILDTESLSSAGIKYPYINDLDGFLVIKGGSDGILLEEELWLIISGERKGDLMRFQFYYEDCLIKISMEDFSIINWIENEMKSVTYGKSRLSHY